MARGDIEIDNDMCTLHKDAPDLAYSQKLHCSAAENSSAILPEYPLLGLGCYRSKL